MLQKISFDESDAVKKLFASYRIRGDILMPKKITDELTVQPTVSCEKGEIYTGKSYDPISKVTYEVERKRPFSVWDLDTKSLTQRKRVEEHLEYLLNILEPHSERINQYLTEEGNYLISFYIRWEPFGDHGSYQISANLLGRMAKLCHFVEYSYIGTCESD